MATETHIQDFLHSKKGEREDDDVVLSEIMEEKVTEFNGNKMKELEKSNEVVESVNTEKETESGNFFQAHSDPVVIAADNEDSTTPESCKAATTEDQEERGSTMIEGSKEELQDKSVESQEDQVEYEDEVKKHSDISNVEINEKPTTFLSKNEDQERKENVVTSSQDGTFEGNESEVVKTKEECIREDNEDTTLKKDIIKEELESLKIDPKEDKREQESTESVNKTVQTYSELKQEEGTEVLQPSIETEEKTEHLHTVTTDDCIKSEKESQVELKEEVKENEVYVSEKDEDFITSEDAKCEDIKESTIGQRGTTIPSFEEEPEEKSIDAQEARELIVETTENEEKARVNDDGQTEKSESLLVKEVSEVKVSERAESELNENEIVSKEEIQEKEKSLKMSEEEEKTIDPQEASGNSEEIVTKIEQSSSEIEQEEDTEETKASVEKGQQACEEEEKYYDTETTMKEVSEEAVLEKVEGLKFYDSLDITLNEKVEDEVKEQEVYASRDGGEDVTSSTPREILNDKSSDVQEASEQYESGVNEKIEQVPEEENVNENEEIKPSVETNEKEEVKIIGNEEDVIEKVQFEGVELSNKYDEQEHIILEEDQGKDDVTCLQDPISIQEDLPKTKYDGGGKEPEFVEPRGYIEEDTEEIKSRPEIKDDIKIGEEAIVDNDGQSITNKSESPENAESELNADEILSKEEIQEKKKEVKMFEDVDVYDDDIIISHNESSKDMKETNIDHHVTTMTSFEEGQNQEDKKEQKLEETTDSKIVESCLEIEQEEDTEEIKPSVETEVRTDSGNGQKENVENSSVNEETDSQNVEHSEGGKETASKIENEENEQEVCMSGKKGGRDDVTSSQDATCEDVKEPVGGQDVTTVVYLEEGHAISSMSKEETAETEENNEESIEKDDGQMEKTFIPSVKEVSEEGAKGMETFKDEYQEKDKVESVNVSENKEEIKPSVETYETKEHEEIPRHEKEMTETRENTEEVLYSVETKEMEENIEKETIINDYGQTNTSESPLVEDVCEVIGSENVVESEEGLKDFESSSRALNPDEIVMKEENQEKEQEPEEVKETMIGQHVKTVVDFEAGKDQSEMTKETLKEEAADKSSDAHEASGQYESEANEKIEQKPEEESIDKYENSEEIKPSVEPYETKEQLKTKCNKEDVSENVKLEGVEHSDKYENQERIISEEGKDDVTCLQDAISIQEDLPKTIYDGEGKEPEFVKPREFIEEDTKEIKPSVEIEQQEVLHVVTTDKCITPQTESQVGNEVKSGEPNQSGDDEKENVDNSIDLEKVEYGEEVKEVTSKIENEEKEQEVYMSGKDQGGEDVKEPIFGQHVTTVAYLEEEQALSSISKEETVKIDEKNKESIESNDGQMEKTLIPLVNEVYEETSKEVCDETISKNIESKEGVKSLETFKDEDQEINKVESVNVIENIEEIKPSMETYELKEEKEITRHEKDVIEARENIDEDIEEVIDSVETKEMEEKIEEETIVNEDGQTDKSESPLVKEACEVTSSEKVESVLNENKIVIKEEKEHELKMSEEVQGGGDDVTSSQDATCEDIKESTIGQHESALTKEILMEEAKDKSIDAQEVNEEYDQNEEKDKTEESANIILHSGSEIEIPSVEIDENKQREVSEKDLQVNEHGFVENRENMKEEDNEVVIKTNIETEEKVQQEKTTTEENNKEPITTDVKETEAFKDEDQVNMSTEGQSEDYVANSHVAGIEEDLQIKKYQEEEKEPKLVEKNGESKEEEDTKEIKSSVETIETLENAENIEEEEAIVNDDGQTEKSESLLVKEVSEVTISKKAESELNENEQKVIMSEEVKDCEDDDITSQNTSSEDIKDIKETKDSNEISKDVILTKEIEQVPLETEKEKETNDLKEQIVEKDSHSIEDQKANVISEIDESPKQALESVCDVQTPEVVVDSEDFKVNEDSIEVRANEVSNSENLEVQKELKHVPELVTEEDQVMENIILTSNAKELSDEVLLELGQPKEEIIEDEITKEDENISHENDNYDTKAEEEKCIQDEIIRETVSVEELNDGLNEASKEKSMELNETPATYGDEEKETVTRDFSIDENLGLQEGLKPASESAIEEDQVKETKHGSEKSDITYENIIKHTSEKDLAYGKRDMEEDVTIAPEKTQIDNTENQNETIKNVILTDEVAVDTEKETENNVKDSPTELDNTSTSTIDQKELSDEIDYSKATPAVNNEEKTESRTDLGNIQAAEVPNLEFVKKEKDDELVSEIQTPDSTVNMEMKEEVLEATNDTCETLTDGSLSEKKLVSMVPPDQELTSSTTEDQTNELGLEIDNAKVDHISISNKDQNLEFTNKEFPDTLVTEEKEDENKEKFEVSENLPENVTEASFTEKNEPKTTTNEKFTSEVDVKDVEKHEKAFDYTTGVVAVDDISKKEAGLESINQENYQSELKKEADEKIEREIPTEKEPKEFDAYVTKDTTGTDELEISQKNKTDDQVKISQTHPEVQKYEPQSSSEVFTEEKKTSDEKTKGNSEVAEHLTEEREKCLKEETGEKEPKTEEENEEEEEDDDEDNQTNDAPVMVEASKDIEVKAHKKSHNILSGVGSKVKHSYAKVKKAITGKSSSPKASSPKEKDHMVT